MHWLTGRKIPVYLLSYNQYLVKVVGCYTTYSHSTEIQLSQSVLWYFHGTTSTWSNQCCIHGTVSMMESLSDCGFRTKQLNSYPWWWTAFLFYLCFFSFSFFNPFPVVHPNPVVSVTVVFVTHSWWCTLFLWFQSLFVCFLCVTHSWWCTPFLWFQSLWFFWFLLWQAGTFRLADQDVLKNRTIRRAKRTMPTEGASSVSRFPSVIWALYAVVLLVMNSACSGFVSCKHCMLWFCSLWTLFLFITVTDDL